MQISNSVKAMVKKFEMVKEDAKVENIFGETNENPFGEEEFVVYGIGTVGGGDAMLAFEKGDAIVVMSTPGDWWYGRLKSNNAKAGWFLKSSVRIEPLKVKAVVLYDYSRKTQSELSVKESQQLFMISYLQGESWWLAETESGERGYVPANYVRLKEEVESLLVESNESKGMMRQSISVISYNELWSDFVGQNVIGSISNEERKRQEAIHELIATESSFAKDVQMVLKTFYVPMSIILKEHELKQIFMNLDDISIASAEFMSGLEALKQQTPVILNLGQVFLKHFDRFVCYKEYCGNQASSSKLLQTLRQSNQSLGDFLKTCLKRPDCRSLDISSFLLQPMQRLTRYPLLLKQILHNTPKSHADHNNIVECLSKAETLLRESNEYARNLESEAKIDEITRKVDLSAVHPKLELNGPTRYLGTRRYVMEGPLNKSKSGKKLYAFLFNDMLLLVTPTRGRFSYSVYRDPILLAETIVRDSKPAERMAGEDGLSFQFVQQRQVISIKAASDQQKKQWLKQLDTLYKLSSQARLSPIAKSEKTDYVGTLQVSVLNGVGIRVDGLHALFVTATLDQQVLKTKAVLDNNPRWNQTLTFSVPSLDSSVSLAVYNYNKYSKDEPIGSCRIFLHFLEYYDNRETERMSLPLEDNSGSLVVLLSFRNVF